ncbi:MAG: glycosyltransferase [Planctomycetota bacterium]|nr:glycosyltransferase [Planctomycetota bacterium]
MRRVLLVTTSFPPSKYVGALRIGRFARMLPEFGWDPVVIAGIEPDAGSPPEWASQVKVVRVPGMFIDKPEAPGDGATEPSKSTPLSTAKRLLGPFRSLARNCWQLVFDTPDKQIRWTRVAREKALQMARECHFDAVVTTGPPHSVQLVGQYLKRQLGIAWIADFRDPWSRHPWGFRVENPWGQRLRPYFERSCVRECDLVILNTDPMRDEFRAAHPKVPSEKFISIANGCDEIMARAVQTMLQSQPVSQPGIPHSRSELVRICHPGSLYHTRDPRPIAEAVGIVRQRGWNVRLEQIGNTSPSFAMEQFLADRNLSDSFILSPPVPQSEVHRRMAESDLLLLLQPGTPLQVPAKLYEMLLFGKPILAVTDEGATADIVNNYGVGVVVRSGNPLSIADALEQLILRKSEITNSNGWERSRIDFDGKTLTSKLAQALDRTVDRTGK